MEKRAFIDQWIAGRRLSEQCVAEVAMRALDSTDQQIALEVAAEDGCLSEDGSTLNIPCKLVGTCSVNLCREDGMLTPLNCPRHEATPQ